MASLSHFFRKCGLSKVMFVFVLVLCLVLLQRIYIHGGKDCLAAQSFQSIKHVHKAPAKVFGAPTKNQFTTPEKAVLKTPTKSPSSPKIQSPEELPLFRDLYTQEAWPQISRRKIVTPDKMPDTVHYIWCGKKRQFRFQHYLGILSIIRLLQPMKIIFHCTHLPVPDKDWYHVWFWELKQSYATLELRRLTTYKDRCETKLLVSEALGFLNETGGTYIGQDILLTRFHYTATQPFWFYGSGDSVLIHAQKGFSAKRKREYLDQILSGRSKCGSIDFYNQFGESKGPPCLLLTEEIRPQHVWATRTHFAELSRWLFYGKREILQAEQSTETSSPRIAHMVWLRREDTSRRKQREFKLYHVLSVLSALHVAGLSHVYIHGDFKPSGTWWDMLQGENVTYVPIDTFQYVFQQHVEDPVHRSDIIRTHLLYIHGGVYMDVDVFVINRLPDDLFRYPTVMCWGWPKHGEWPAVFNTGVMISHPQAPWLRLFLASMRKYLDWSWGYNGTIMSYKVYETHPETLHVDDHLQVICHKGYCHPTWQDGYQQDVENPILPEDFDWREARAYHTTVPNPPKSLHSLEELKKEDDMFAKIGRLILTKSGRGALIGNP